MFSTIEINIGNVHVQSTNCIDVNVAGGLHNQCMNHTMAVGNNTSHKLCNRKYQNYFFQQLASVQTSNSTTTSRSRILLRR